jgi:hypothetical protein
MINVVPIVEGDGEVAALPVLLRRIGDWLTPGLAINIVRPIRVRREQFLNKPEIFSKQLHVAAALCSTPGWILILLDADDDCPKALAELIHAKALAVTPGQNISVVLANREYEAWFIAAANSLNGKRGFICPATLPDADAIRGAKQWLSKQIVRGAYHEVVDQPALSAQMDLQQVHDNSRSFRKLCGDWTVLMASTATV